VNAWARSADAVLLRVACASGASCRFVTFVTAHSSRAAAAAGHSRPVPSSLVIAGRATRTVSPGHASTVGLPINAAGHRLLARAGRLVVRITIEIGTPGALRRVATRTLLLRAARRRG